MLEEYGYTYVYRLFNPHLSLIESNQPSQTPTLKEFFAQKLSNIANSRMTINQIIVGLYTFDYNKEAYKELTPFLTACKSVACNVPYKNDELALARRYGHITTKQTARLMQMANVGEVLVLANGTRTPRAVLLDEVREGFAQAR